MATGTGLSSTATEKLRGKCLDHLLQELPDVKQSTPIPTSSQFIIKSVRTEYRSGLFEYVERPVNILHTSELR